jgi:glycerate kinase
MKIVIAMDSFKGSLSALEAGTAAKEGILEVYPDAEIAVCALADGGEGTVRAIVGATGGRFESVRVHDPLGRRIEAEYGVIGTSETVVAEIAETSGLTLLCEEERDPWEASTFGFGEMLRNAIEKGYRDFIIGIGGSATNDGGFGMLRALGFDFLDRERRPIALGAKGLRALSYIETANALPALSECRFTVACDVKNPLCGENGCSAVFAPQKGASPEAVKEMDGLLARYAALTEKAVGRDESLSEGSGAAGGLGFAFLAYLGASLRSGAQTVMEAVSLEERVRDADVLITGEGRLDFQSFMGKAPVEAARIAKKYGKRVIALAGAVSNHLENGLIDAFFPIVGKPCTLDEAIDKEAAKTNMRRTAEQVFRLIRAAMRMRCEECETDG